MVASPPVDQVPVCAPPAGKYGWPWSTAVVSRTDGQPDDAHWPKISVITPSYNQGEFLEETIRSVLLQEYPHLEYIIMDGGSTDNSVDIIRKYEGHIHHWESKRDRGQSHAINKGFELLSGDIIGWLNSDDVLLPNALFRVAEALQVLPDVDVVHGEINYVNSQGELLHLAQRREHEFQLDNVLVGSIYQPGTFWRRSVTDEIGLLNENLHYVMDYEYWMRMALAGAKFHYLAGMPLANFRVTESSKTGTEQHGFGFETRDLIDWFVTMPGWQATAERSSWRKKRQEMKARAGANLRIAQGLCHSEGQRLKALVWLARSVRQYPTFLWIRRHELIDTVRKICK